jgi:hypothetical protein
MMTTGTIDPGRSRWQFLFPEGLREEYPRPGGQSVVTTYTPKWCQGIVDRFRRFRAASEAYGMPAQPLPVQIQHVGVHGTGSIEDRRRVGSIYDLVYIPRGGTIPGGVWALIEWTAEGLDLINSGKFNCLSPTNSSFGTLSTGERIPGDFLVEVSLVDVPFLEAIGTAADYLPFGAIPYTGSRSTSAIAARSAMPVKRNLSPAWLAAHDDGLVIARGAQFRSLPMEPTESVEIEVSPDALTPEVVEALFATEAARMKMRELCREMCREMMEADLEGILDARGYMKREMAAPTLPDLTEAANIVAQARAIEEEVIAGEVKELVRSGRLLAAHVGDFVARRKVGDKVDGLLRDWSGASTMQGIAGTTPREKAPASGRVTADGIMKAVERELIARGKGYSYAEHLRVAKARINDARSKGELVEG